MPSSSSSTRGSDLDALSAKSPATVALVAGPAADLDRGIAVPFGGSEHDWAALELAAQLARGPIRLVGTRAHPGRRDASRLLADASLTLQRIANVRNGACTQRRPAHYGFRCRSRGRRRFVEIPRRRHRNNSPRARRSGTPRAFRPPSCRAQVHWRLATRTQASLGRWSQLEQVVSLSAT